MRALAWPVAVVLLLAGCTSADDPDPEPVRVQWAEKQLPAPAGAPGRNVLRDAVECGDGWWVVGAVFLDEPTETRDTRPAAWFSADLETWTSVPIDARTYWGRRAILNSIACSRDRIAVVGARSGGAHGNPRVTTFRTEGKGPDDGLVDVSAVFIQYGGVTATNVGPIAGGPAGWLITGNRISGPGVWFTDDPREFTRVEGEPGLTGEGGDESLAQSGGWAGDEWVVVGTGPGAGGHLDADPVAWTSSDGLAWTVEEMPSGEGAQDAHRVAVLDDGDLLAVGLSYGRFASWVRGDDGWSEPASFGAVADSWTGAPYVASLAMTPAGILATVSTGQRYEMWQTDDGRSWTQVDAPLEPQTAGDHTLVAAGGGSLLVVGDAGDGGHVWVGKPTQQRISP